MKLKKLNVESRSRRKYALVFLTLTMLMGGSAYWLYVNKDVSALIGFSFYAAACVVSLAFTLKNILPLKYSLAGIKFLRRIFKIPEDKPEKVE